MFLSGTAILMSSATASTADTTASVFSGPLVIVFYLVFFAFLFLIINHALRNKAKLRRIFHIVAIAFISVYVVAVISVAVYSKISAQPQHAIVGTWKTNNIYDVPGVGGVYGAAMPQGGNGEVNLKNTYVYDENGNPFYSTFNANGSPISCPDIGQELTFKKNGDFIKIDNNIEQDGTWELKDDILTIKMPSLANTYTIEKYTVKISNIYYILFGSTEKQTGVYSGYAQYEKKS